MNRCIPAPCVVFKHLKTSLLHTTESILNCVEGLVIKILTESSNDLQPKTSVALKIVLNKPILSYDLIIVSVVVTEE